MPKAIVTTFVCNRCGNVYGPRDDAAGGGRHDEDWQPFDGRCYECFLKLMFELFGGWMEPTFVLNGKRYAASGLVHDESCDRDCDGPAF